MRRFFAIFIVAIAAVVFGGNIDSVVAGFDRACVSFTGTIDQHLNQFVRYGGVYGGAIVPFGLAKTAPSEAIKKVSVFLYDGRESQEILWSWGSPILAMFYRDLHPYKQQKILNVFGQVIDYLNSFDYQTEVSKATSVDFYKTAGSGGMSAKACAFCYRRIVEYQQSGEGLSLEDCRYWTKAIYNTLLDNSNVLARVSRQKK